MFFFSFYNFNQYVVVSNCDLKFLWQNIHNKIYHSSHFLSVQFTGIKYSHTVMQPSPSYCDFNLHFANDLSIFFICILSLVKYLFKSLTDFLIFLTSFLLLRPHLISWTKDLENSHRKRICDKIKKKC